MYQITVDGLQGAGKSSVCKKVAENLGILYYDLDLAKYAIALCCVERNINPTNQQKVLDLLRDIKIDLKQSQNHMSVFVDGRDVTRLIKHPMVLTAAYSLSKLEYIDRYLKILQLQAAKNGSIVVEGYNTGSTVFPNAKYKFFLTANADIRAKRKYEALMQAGVTNISFEKVLNDTIESDRHNYNGEMSKIKIPSECIFIDTSFLTVLETSQQITDIVKGNQ